MQTDRPVTNSPRTLNSEGDPLLPGSFEFISISVIRKNTIEEIKDIVNRIDIVQDLDSPAIIATLVIRDNRGFFENSKIKLLGHEMILIRIREKLHKNENLTPKELTMRFVVQEYRDFEVDDRGIYTKQFVIDAISHYAYLSRIGKISKSVKGDPIENIANIINDNLLYNKDKFFDYDRSKNLCTSHFSGVITYRTPMQAIKWLKSKAYDSVKSPFYVFSRLYSGSIIARSWSYLINKNTNSPYKKYFQKKSTNDKPGSYAAYFSEKNKILEIIVSNKNNEILKAISGKYTSRLKTVDYSNLSYIEDDINIIEKNVLSPEETKQQTADDKALNELLETIGVDFNDINNFKQDRINPSEITFQKAYPLFSDNTKSSRDIDYDHIIERQYYNTKINFENYQIVVYGDLNLNPGMMIELEIPKPDSKDNKSEISGFYIISLVVHSFENGKYVNRLSLIKI